MKKKFLFFIGLSFLFISQSLIAQNVVINYEAWNPSNPPCNLFASATSVPATINGSPGSVQHQTLIGQPEYITTSKHVLLRVSSSSSTQYLGTKISIAYNFKKGYRYIVTVKAAAQQNTTGTANGPYLRLDLSNSGGSSTGCAGPLAVTPNLSGNPAPVQFPSATFIDQTFGFTNYYSAEYSYLTLTAIPASNAATNGIKIKSITIEESLVPPVFTLSPGETNITCGSTDNVLFTVNNTTFTPTLRYSWNLGATPNGWLLNNAPAPASVLTIANTLTLKPACEPVHKPVAVTVFGAGGSYQTNSAQFTNVAPTMAVTGDQSICSGSKTYTVGGLPCGSTVTWTSSNPSIASVTSSNNVATLTRIGSGSVRLTATITSACVSTARFKDIGIGAVTTPSISYVKEAGSQTMYVFTATGTAPNLGFDWYVNNVLIRQNADAVTYLEIPCGQTKSVKCVQTTVCGTSPFSNTVTVTNICPSSFIASPNPADDVIIVEEHNSVAQHEAKTFGSEGIDQIKVFDQSGNLKKTIRFDGKSRKVQVNVSNLNPGIYIIEVSRGKFKERLKISRK